MPPKSTPRPKPFYPALTPTSTTIPTPTPRDLEWLFNTILMDAQPPINVDCHAVAARTGANPASIARRINILKQRYPGLGVFGKLTGNVRNESVSRTPVTPASGQGKGGGVDRKNGKKDNEKDKDRGKTKGWAYVPVSAEENGEGEEEGDAEDDEKKKSEAKKGRGARTTGSRSRVAASKKQTREDDDNESDDASAAGTSQRKARATSLATSRAPASEAKRTANEGKSDPAAKKSQKSSKASAKKSTVPSHDDQDDKNDERAEEDEPAAQPKESGKKPSPKTRGGRKSAGLRNLKDIGGELGKVDKLAPRGRHALSSRVKKVLADELDGDQVSELSTVGDVDQEDVENDEANQPAEIEKGRRIEDETVDSVEAEIVLDVPADTVAEGIEDTEPASSNEKARAGVAAKAESNDREKHPSNDTEPQASQPAPTNFIDRLIVDSVAEEIAGIKRRREITPDVPSSPLSAPATFPEDAMLDSVETSSMGEIRGPESMAAEVAGTPSRPPPAKKQKAEVSSSDLVQDVRTNVSNSHGTRQEYDIVFGGSSAAEDVNMENATEEAKEKAIEWLDQETTTKEDFAAAIVPENSVKSNDRESVREQAHTPASINEAADQITSREQSTNPVSPDTMTASDRMFVSPPEGIKEDINTQTSHGSEARQQSSMHMAEEETRRSNFSKPLEYMVWNPNAVPAPVPGMFKPAVVIGGRSQGV